MASCSSYSHANAKDNMAKDLQTSYVYKILTKICMSVTYFYMGFLAASRINFLFKLKHHVQQTDFYF